MPPSKYLQRCKKSSGYSRPRTESVKSCTWKSRLPSLLSCRRVATKKSRQSFQHFPLIRDTTYATIHIIPRGIFHLGTQFSSLTLFPCQSLLHHCPSSIFKQLMAPRPLISMYSKVSLRNQLEIHLPYQLLRINPTISLAFNCKLLLIKHLIICSKVPMDTISTKVPRKLTK